MINEKQAAHMVPGIKQLKLIDIRESVDHPVARPLIRLAAPLLESLLGLKELNREYSRIVAESKDRDIMQVTLDVMQSSVNVSDTDLRKIPKHGPLTLVANHPFGGFEGMALAQLLAQLRPDVKILGNYLLTRIHGMSDRIIPVDPFGNRASVRKNAHAIKSAVNWVRDGGALLTFPAGEVSHFRWKEGEVSDSEWSPHIGALIEYSASAVVPIFIEGRNSLLFQVAGMIHPVLRTALLPRELLNKRKSVLNIRVGNVVRGAEWQGTGTSRELTEYLRHRTYFIRYRQSEEDVRRITSVGSENMQPLAAALDAGVIRDAVDNLPADALLASHSELDVYAMRAAQSDALMHEIARLREFTFREAFEGSGNALDRDEFDDTYYHLFLWNRERGEIAGAYRLGCCDELLRKNGIDGLYTNTLFKFADKFTEHLGDAVEVGRSFVRPEYQRHFASLSLLWRGIGEFLVRRPRYRKLFGPVSIGKNYNPMSRAVIVRYLRRYKLNQTMAALTAPRNPFESNAEETAAVLTLQRGILNSTDVSNLIGDIESDGKGMPILLQHYLKLNARVMEFNVDPQFSDVLDALIWLDLNSTEDRFLKRYMGAEGFQRFRSHGDKLVVPQLFEAG